MPDENHLFIHWGSSLEESIAQFKGFYLENYGKERVLRG